MASLEKVGKEIARMVGRIAYARYRNRIPTRSKAKRAGKTGGG